MIYPACSNVMQVNDVRPAKALNGIVLKKPTDRSVKPFGTDTATATEVPATAVISYVFTR